MNLKNDIYLGDCLLKLREIADNSVDLIVTSLPYAESQRKNIYGGISKIISKNAKQIYKRIY